MIKMIVTQREKLIVLAGVVLLGLLAAIQIFVRPALERIRTLERIAAEKQKNLSDLKTQSKEYNDLKNRLEKLRLAIATGQKDKKILSFVEGIQRQYGLMQKVVSITPTTTAINDIYEKTYVEVKYGAVTLEQIVRLLSKIEFADMPLGIRTIEIKRNIQNAVLLDMTVQLVGISSLQTQQQF
jgi:hypothetical protein